MTLSRPLETLLSPEKAQILSALDRTGQPLTGRTIAALTGTVSQATVSRQLLQLCELGLVLKVPGGYELNRDHLSYPALAALFEIPDELQRRIAADVARWNSPPLSVVLFGSVARREEWRGSDIDLLVVRPESVPFDDLRWAADVATLSERVTRWCGSPCEVLEYTPGELADLERGHDPLIETLRRDGITLTGASLGTVLETIPG